MLSMSRLMGLFAVPLLLALIATATAQDANIKQPVADLERLLAAEPLVITQAEISRPKAKGDITLRADVSFGGAAPLVPLADFAKYSPGVQRTFPTVDQVLAVVQYWLSDIKAVADVYDP